MNWNWGGAETREFIISTIKLISAKRKVLQRSSSITPQKDRASKVKIWNLKLNAFENKYFEGFLCWFDGISKTLLLKCWPQTFLWCTECYHMHLLPRESISGRSNQNIWNGGSGESGPVTMFVGKFLVRREGSARRARHIWHSIVG